MYFIEVSVNSKQNAGKGEKNIKDAATKSTLDLHLSAVLIAVIVIGIGRPVATFTFRSQVFEQLAENDYSALVKNGVLQMHNLKKQHDGKADTSTAPQRKHLPFGRSKAFVF